MNGIERTYERLDDLLDRLRRAEKVLSENAERAAHNGSIAEESRIYAKAEGVRLARSYVEEMQR